MFLKPFFEFQHIFVVSFGCLSLNFSVPNSSFLVRRDSTKFTKTFQCFHGVLDLVLLLGEIFGTGCWNFGVWNSWLHMNIFNQQFNPKYGNILTGPPHLGENGSFDFTTVSMSVYQYVSMSEGKSVFSKTAYRIFLNFSWS